MYYDHNNHNNRKELLKRIFYLSGITVGVYLLFAYVLVLVIPFLFAFAFVRAMWPFAERIGINTGMSKKCTGYILAGTVTLLLTVVFAGIGYGLYIQLRKLVCNFSYIQLVLENNINHMCCVFEESFNIRNGTIRNMLISSSDGVMNICVDKILPYENVNVLSILPMNHLFEMTVGFSTFLNFGFSVYYTPSLKPKDVLSIMREKQIEFMIVVPAFLKLLKTGLEAEMKNTSKFSQKMFPILYHFAKFVPFIWMKKINTELEFHS